MSVGEELAEFPKIYVNQDQDSKTEVLNYLKKEFGLLIDLKIGFKPEIMSMEIEFYVDPEFITSKNIVCICRNIQEDDSFDNKNKVILKDLTQLKKDVLLGKIRDSMTHSGIFLLY